jgi:hypothetical protein
LRLSQFDEGFAERLRYEIDPAWQGDIPRTILISRNGDTSTIEAFAVLKQAGMTLIIIEQTSIAPWRSPIVPMS